MERLDQWHERGQWPQLLLDDKYKRLYAQCECKQLRKQQSAEVAEINLIIPAVFPQLQFGDAPYLCALVGIFGLFLAVEDGI